MPFQGTNLFGQKDMLIVGPENKFRSFIIQWAETIIIPTAVRSFQIEANDTSEGKICATIKNSGPVRLEIFNNRGQIIDVLVDDIQRHGSHMVVWNADNLPSGTYYYRLLAEGFQETKRMTLLR